MRGFFSYRVADAVGLPLDGMVVFRVALVAGDGVILKKERKIRGI